MTLAIVTGQLQVCQAPEIWYDRGAQNLNNQRLMKMEWIISMPVSYCVMAVSADRKSVIAKTNSGAIYQISRAIQDRITKSEFDAGVSQGIYRAVEGFAPASIDEIRETIQLMSGRSIQSGRGD